MLLLHQLLDVFQYVLTFIFDFLKDLQKIENLM